MSSRRSLTETLVDAIEATLAMRGGRRQGAELRYRCAEPGHDDRNPSARWHPSRRVWWCDVCGVGGGAIDLAGRLGIVAGGRATTLADRRRMADRATRRGERDAHASTLRTNWLTALAELRRAQSDVAMVRALLSADPEEREPSTRTQLDALGDPYLREQVAEQRLDEIEAADRERREVRRAAA